MPHPDVWQRVIQGLGIAAKADHGEPWCAGLLEQLPVAIYACDADGLIAGFNQEAVRIWGRTPAKFAASDRYCGAWRVYAMDGSALSHERSVTAAALRFRQPSRVHQMVYEQPDGRRLVVHARANPIHDRDGELLGAVAVLVAFGEYTGKSPAVDPLLATALVRVAPAGIFRTDAQGHCCFVNDRWCEIAGIDHDTALGDGWAQGLHPDDRERVVREWNEAVARAAPFHAEYRFCNAAMGTTIWVVGQAAAERDGAGQILGHVGVITDITEQKRAEAERSQLQAQIQQAQKMESLGVLAGGIAHDFNNLLTSMLGYSSLARTRLPADSSAAAMLQEIEKAAQRAAELTRQMLAYSGRGAFEIQTMRLDVLVREMARLLMTVITKKATLQLELEPAAIVGDATQVRQLVMNLITNASDALGDAGGDIFVRTGQRPAATAELTTPGIGEPLPAGTYAFLEVRDTGCGMDAATRARIFEPFFTTKFAGRGLGLAAALGIVRGHRGVIRIDSATGCGSNFEVLLPAAPLAGVAEPEPWTAPGRAHRGGTILLADDEPGVRAFVGHVLREAGFEIIEAKDGVAATAAFDRHRDAIVAVLLDMTMPRMDGREVLLHLRASACEVPVLIMSGYSDIEVASHCAGIGADGFLQKPLRPDKLLRRVLEALSA